MFMNSVSGYAVGDWHKFCATIIEMYSVTKECPSLRFPILRTYNVELEKQRLALLASANYKKKCTFSHNWVCWTIKHAYQRRQEYQSTLKDSK